MPSVRVPECDDGAIYLTQKREREIVGNSRAFERLLLTGQSDPPIDLLQGVDDHTRDKRISESRVYVFQFCPMKLFAI